MSPSKFIYLLVNESNETLKHISIALFCAALALLPSERPQRFTYLINALGAFTIFSKARTLLIYNPPAK